MVRRMVVSLAVLGALGLGGCMSLNFDENTRQINHYGKSLHDMRVLTNKYFFDYDEDNPFED